MLTTIVDFNAIKRLKNILVLQISVESSLKNLFILIKFCKVEEDR